MAPMMDEQSGIYTTPNAGDEQYLPDDDPSVPETSQNATLCSGIYTTFEERSSVADVFAANTDKTTEAPMPQGKEAAYDCANNLSPPEKEISQDSGDVDNDENSSYDFNVAVLADHNSMVSSLESGGELFLFPWSRQVSNSIHARPAYTHSILHALEEQVSISSPPPRSLNDDVELGSPYEAESVDTSIFGGTYASLWNRLGEPRRPEQPIQTYQASATTATTTTTNQFIRHSQPSLDKEVRSNDSDASSNAEISLPPSNAKELLVSSFSTAENSSSSESTPPGKEENGTSLPAPRGVKVGMITAFCLCFLLLVMLVAGVVFSGAIVVEKHSSESSSTVISSSQP